MDTGDKELVEASHRDGIWGIGLSRDDARRGLGLDMAEGDDEENRKSKGGDIKKLGVKEKGKGGKTKGGRKTNVEMKVVGREGWGMNLLGKALMKARERLRGEER